MMQVKQFHLNRRSLCWKLLAGHLPVLVMNHPRLLVEVAVAQGADRVADNAGAGATSAAAGEADTTAGGALDMAGATVAITAGDPSAVT